MKEKSKSKFFIGILLCVLILLPIVLFGCGGKAESSTQMLYGTDTPSAQGKDGDFYLDIDDYILYQKVNNEWTVIIEDFGKPGENGEQGNSLLTGESDPLLTDGDNGDLFLNTISHDLFKKEDGQWLFISNLLTLEDREYYTNLFDHTSAENIDGGYLLPSGNFHEADSYFVTHLIPVELNKQYVWKTLGGSAFGESNYRIIYFYDENGEYIMSKTAEIIDDGGTDSPTSEGDDAYLNDDIMSIVITDPSVKYVRLCGVTYGIRKTSFMFVPGSEYPDEFISYGEIVYKDTGIDLTEDEYNMLISQNPLYKKSIAFEGDSICAGGAERGNYAEFIAENNEMDMTNNSVGGGTITSGIYTTSGILRHSIVDGVEALVASGNYDYIIFEGGVNDKALDSSYRDEGEGEDNQFVTFGEITSSYSEELNKNTFCGAFESICKTLALSGKKVGYIFVHKIYNDTLWNETYKPTMIKILEKWGVPYLDLETTVPPLNMIAELRDTYTIENASTGRGDGWHPNELGYKTFYVDQITAWLKTL